MTIYWKNIHIFQSQHVCQTAKLYAVINMLLYSTVMLHITTSGTRFLIILYIAIVFCSAGFVLLVIEQMDCYSFPSTLGSQTSARSPP